MKFITVLTGLLFVLPGFAETNTTFKMEFPRWGPSIRAGSAYHFETDLDQGGAFSVNRYFIEAGLSRMWNFDRMISVSAGYGQDDYRFSNPATEPWNNIDNFRVGLFARWALDDRWVAFAGPSIRTYAESGASMGDAFSPVFFGGASYKFSDRLTLGPGFGVVGQLEDDASFFPVLIVKWGITERLNLETGGGLAATGGPGISLNYDVTKKWKAGITGRYEKKRFRLDRNGPAPDGIGEDRNIPLILNFSYQIYPGGSVGAFLGLNFNGKISAENSSGNKVYQSEYSTSKNVGLVARFRF